jgi:WD40 repeat protein
VTGAVYRYGVTGFGPGTGQRRRFPALDPEPPPPPWWRRLVIPAALLAVAGAVVAVVQLYPSPATGPQRTVARAGHSTQGLPAGPRIQAPGRIAAITPTGALVLANPDGTQLTRVHGLGNVGQNLTRSPGGRYLALFNGQLVSVKQGPALASYPSKIPLSSLYSVAWPQPFADHDRAVVMLHDYGDPSQSASNPIFVASIASGNTVPLGNGDSVAGDPQAAGVFVTVAAPLGATATSLADSPDSAVVLRDAGHAAVRLATAVQLARDLGLHGRPPVSLAVFPSPSGREVAVTVRPAAGGPARGIVVLSRAGRLIARIPGTLAAFSGPVGDGTGPVPPVWSPSGRSLAYLSASQSGRQGVGIWSARGHLVASELPATNGSYDGCIWSPDDRLILCAAAGGDWAVASARSGPAGAARGAGFPVAWLR